MAFGVYVCIICMHQKREALINYILRVEREREREREYIDNEKSDLHIVLVNFMST